jgi:hypothetical protein
MSSANCSHAGREIIRVAGGEDGGARERHRHPAVAIVQESRAHDGDNLCAAATLSG